MTEESIPQEKPKKYLLLADDLHMALLAKLMPGLLFVQVEGIAVENNDNYMILVNPIKKEEEIKDEQKA